MRPFNTIGKVSLTSALAMFCAQESFGVWAINYMSISPGTGGSASGVWRDVSDGSTGSGTDSTFSVSFNTSGDVQSLSDPSTPSNISEAFPWLNFISIGAGEEVLGPDGNTYINPLPFPASTSLPFSAGTRGDFVSVETDINSSSTVTIDFGAKITNPMLSFSDIDTETTLIFTDPFSVSSSTTNLSSTATTVFNNQSALSGTLGILFEEEAAGSLQFTGEFTSLSFTIQNGADASGEDRTGFIVTTESAPELVPEPAQAPMLLGFLALGISLLRRKR